MKKEMTYRLLEGTVKTVDRGADSLTFDSGGMLYT
jgi:hypothetical protein